MGNDLKNHLLHGREVVVDRLKLEKVIATKQLNFKGLYTELVDNYGLDIEYKSFMNLINNRTSWKLLYAWITAEYLNMSIYDLFKLIVVDIEGKKRDIKRWNEKYKKS